MKHPFDDGTLVRVTGDTGRMGHWFDEGEVCKVIEADTSDSTYFLKSTGLTGEVYWVHFDDVEVMK